MIDVKHLSKSFGEVEVLKDINETIDKGEKVVIVGPSGSGKSTFLRCLNLMEKPTSGDTLRLLDSLCEHFTIEIVSNRFHMARLLCAQQISGASDLKITRVAILKPLPISVNSRIAWRRFSATSFNICFCGTSEMRRKSGSTVRRGRGADRAVTVPSGRNHG